jgi:hypothetical protein
MRVLRWTAIASLATFLCGAGFYLFMRYAVGGYYIHTGAEIPLFVRQLIIFSAIFRRFAWVLMPFAVVCWFIFFLIVRLIRGDRSQAASAS